MIQVSISAKFLKELAKIPSKERTKIEQFVFEEIKKIDSINLIPKLEKLQGNSDSYKIRFGNYRVGVNIENNAITFMRVLHRKEIYKYFP
jgi:mRNA interferase RelE/StbE